MSSYGARITSKLRLPECGPGRCVYVHRVASRSRDEVDQPRLSLRVRIDLARHAADLEQLGRVLKRALSRAVGNRQLEIEVTLRAIEPVELVGVVSLGGNR
jgi:hypothetical protein